MVEINWQSDWGSVGERMPCSPEGIIFDVAKRPGVIIEVLLGMSTWELV